MLETIDFDTATESDLLRWLAERIPELREPCLQCFGQGEWPDPEIMQLTQCEECHGLGYTPKRDMEPLLEVALWRWNITGLSLRLWLLRRSQD